MELWRKHDIIIDTCVFLWVVNNEQKKLSKLAKKAINEAQNIYVSCMSYAEILRKVKVGKMSGLKLQLFCMGKKNLNPRD